MKVGGAESELDTAKKEQLFNVACEICHVHGPIKLSIDRVAREAGISKRTIYKYYKDRNRFIAALIEHEAEQWREWFFNAVDEEKAHSDSSIQAFFNVLSVWLASDNFQGLLFAHVFFAYKDAMPDCISEKAHHYAGLLHEFLKESLLAAGVPEPDAGATEILILVLTMVSGVVTIRLDEGPDKQAGTVLLHLLEKMYPGIIRAGRRPSFRYRGN